MINSNSARIFIPKLFAKQFCFNSEADFTSHFDRYLVKPPSLTETLNI